MSTENKVTIKQPTNINLSLVELFLKTQKKEVKK